VITQGDNNMMCAVTYKNSSGGTITMNSNVFDFSGQSLSVSINQGNDAVSGCSNPVTFTTSTFSQSGLFDPPSANYSVSWAPPAGWTLSSQSNGGQNVSFTPDASSGGGIVANLTYTASCTYTAHTSASITRTIPATSWSTSNPSSVCGGNSTTLAITPMCGASSYTYTVTGNATFAANGAQSYTTSATSVAVNIPSSGENTFYCTANYPNGSSSQVAWAVQSGLPAAPTGCKIGSADCPEWSFTCDAAPAGETYNWNYINLSNFQVTNLGGGTTCCMRINFQPGTGNFVVQVTATNGCGTGPQSAISASPNCGGTGGHSIAPAIGTDQGTAFNDSALANFTVYPNPAKGYLKISVGSAQNDLTGIREAFLYNSLGVQVAAHSYKDAPRQVYFYLNELPAGVYLLKVGDDKHTISKTVLIAK
jgi:hypothetical protein